MALRWHRRGYSRSGPDRQGVADRRRRRNRPGGMDSWTSFGGTPSDSLKVSIVCVLLQENPDLTIQIGMDVSSDPYLGVCWRDPGTSLPLENATASFCLLFPLERWPWVVGPID